MSLRSLTFVRPQRLLWLVVVCVILAGAACADESVRIGIVYTADKGRTFAESGKDENKNYRDAVETCGATVVVLSQHEPRDDVRARFALLDGLLLPGGIDVEPKRYGEAPHPKLEKVDGDLDALEFDALEYAKNHGLPVLGICRGHQILNVYYGGSLYQDIPSQCESAIRVSHRFPEGSAERREHEITVVPGSILRELWNTDRLTVNTYHHQAVKEVAPGFAVAARSDDGIIEAIERKEGVFVLGVQFHPEKMLQDEPRMKVIFERFVEEARRVAQTRPNQGVKR